MSNIYEGVGASIAFGTTIEGTLKFYGISGSIAWERAVIDTSHLGLTAWKTKVIAKLKDGQPFTVQIAEDPAVPVISDWSRNESIVITLPDSIGTITVWGGVTNITSGDLVIDEKPTMALTITPTNQNGSAVETGPVFTAS